MISTQPARTQTPRIRIRRLRVAGLLVAVAAIAATAGDRLPGSSSSTAPSASTASPLVPRSEHGAPRTAPSAALGEADGALPEGTTAFDTAITGVARLDPALLDALREAATDAAADGVALHVDSGWRSPDYQEHLRREAVSKYGSDAEAARWVAGADTSPHVAGDAVDVGPADAAAWLSARGAEYGLCQIYANEPWHYELRAEAVAGGCPPMYPDPTHDPRMHK